MALSAGDAFETLPQGPFDLVLCAGFTNMFGEDRNRELLRRLRPVVAPHGALAIITTLRDRSPTARLFAVQMLLVGGDTYSEAQYRRWLTETGYGRTEVIDLPDRGSSLLLAGVTSAT